MARKTNNINRVTFQKITCQHYLFTVSNYSQCYATWHAITFFHPSILLITRTRLLFLVVLIIHICAACFLNCPTGDPWLYTPLIQLHYSTATKLSAECPQLIDCSLYTLIMFTMIFWLFKALCHWYPLGYVGLLRNGRRVRWISNFDRLTIKGRGFRKRSWSENCRKHV